MTSVGFPVECVNDTGMTFASSLSHCGGPVCGEWAKRSGKTSLTNARRKLRTGRERRCFEKAAANKKRRATGLEHEHHGRDVVRAVREML